MIIEKGDIFLERMELDILNDDQMWITVGIRKNKSSIKINREDAIKIVEHLKQQFEI